MKKLFLLGATFVGLTTSSILAQGTAFTYQGRLVNNGVVANGSYDLRFTMYDAATSGTIMGGPITNTATSVSNGLFVATLDFGSGVFNGFPRWLEIGVRSNGTGSFNALSPLQSITAAPYAIMAANVAGFSFHQNTNGAPNVVEGAPGNFVSNGVVGATISGGGSSNYTDAFNSNHAYTNSVTGDFGTVGGGYQNVAGPFGTVGGGNGNNASGSHANIGGGGLNIASDQYAVVAGGYGNQATNYGAAVGGGYGNVAGAQYATVAGGYLSSALGFGAVAAGDANSASNQIATAAGGYANRANGYASVVSGGYYNAANGDYSTISGGRFGAVGGNYGTVAGGLSNLVNGNYSAVGGGLTNNASGDYAFVGGGYGNQASGSEVAIGGGDDNIANGQRATVAGGFRNIASSPEGTVGGGDFNIASGVEATVPGGGGNTASGWGSFAAGLGATALHNGAFVWADNTGGTFSSTSSNQFLIRAGGGVGIGTGSPGGALDVRGNIRLGPSGQYYTPGGEENLRIIRGVLNSVGATIVGSGFTTTNPTTGIYVVTFNTPFTGPPAVTATGDSGGGVPRVVMTDGVTANAVTFRAIVSTTGAASQFAFHFIAIGPR